MRSSKNLTGVRGLEVALLLAERAWALAMERQEEVQNTDPLNRAKFHSRRRLAKASLFANRLKLLAEKEGDPRTILEAEVYEFFMAGSVALDREKWGDALNCFVRAQTVCEQLAKVGEAEQQIVFRERAEQLENNIRLCKYKRDRMASSSTEAFAEIKDIKAGLDDVLRSKLDSMIQEARSKQAEGLEKIIFGTHTIPLKNQKVKLLFVSIGDSLLEINDPSKTNIPVETQIDRFNILFQFYDDALSLIKQDLLDVQQLENKTAKNTVQEENLSALFEYVTCQKLQYTMQRNILLAQGLVEQWNRRDEESNEKTKPKIKADSVVRIFELIIQNAEGILKYREYLDASIVDGASSQLEIACAYRCYYLAQSYTFLNHHLEAIALLQRSSEYAEKALRIYSERPSAFATQTAAALNLQKKILSEKSILHASAFMKASSNAPASNLNPFLLDRLDAFEAGDATSQYRLILFPPQLEATPNKPIFFDLASHFIQFNSIDARMKKTGFFASFLVR